MIPIAKPSVGEEEAHAAATVIKSGLLASGQEVKEFEREFSSYIGTNEGVATSNGTTALHIAQTALGIGPGDEVIVPSFTFIATATSVSMCGASPVMADIEEKTYCIDPDSVMDQINPHTKAVIGVHLYGHPCDVHALSEICEDHSLFFVEDCAQAHGAEYRSKKVGNFGVCGCFSFYPTKNMTCGEGGMVTSSDPSLVKRMRILINHGQTEKYLHTELGYNFRLTDIAAAIGRVQLHKLPEMNKKRMNNGTYLSQHITRKGIITPAVRPGCNHVYHQYAIRVTEESGFFRDELAEFLNNHGIGTGVHYPMPVHEQPVYKGKVRGSSCPVAGLISPEILSLPVHPGLSEEEREDICRVMNGDK